MRIRKYILVAGLFIFTIYSSFAQSIDLKNNECPAKSRLAKLGVEIFIQLAGSKDFREQIGASGETVEQVQAVENGQTCSALNDFISNNRKFNNINQSYKDTDKQVYFYKTDNFYYVFWGRKPEFDDRPATGPKTLFIVIKNDLSQFWEYYF
ncbi:hypothetical protein [Marivirga atlantica]|uniref:Uncharacterized protein n=1 Tax=Marivirga atlantica TaxID=1548457 RepID=A0A937AAG5_9BACT|nr:hypothetical protein [Marivirga atlantica]MBL0766615.1 hypothetical protein [Marivirga atlantica]